LIFIDIYGKNQPLKLFFMKIVLTHIFLILLFVQTFAQKKPLVVFVLGDHEYSGEVTLPIIATELEKKYGIRCKILASYPNQNSEQNIPGLEALKNADLAVFFLRWRQLPTDQLAHIEAYLKSGKPVMGFRTTTHAFNYPKGHESEAWNEFGEWAFNSPPGWGKKGHIHYGHTSTTAVRLDSKNNKHPILTGVSPTFSANSWLYNVVPDYPSLGSESLLIGTAINSEKPNPNENPVAWIGKNKYGANMFFTTLGHPEDFKDPSMQRLIINAIHFQLGKKVPKKLKNSLSINVPYRGIVK
jgi:type 1 glutamine amidotransferase